MDWQCRITCREGSGRPAGVVAVRDGELVLVAPPGEAAVFRGAQLRQQVEVLSGPWPRGWSRSRAGGPDMARPWTWALTEGAGVHATAVEGPRPGAEVSALCGAKVVATPVLVGVGWVEPCPSCAALLGPARPTGRWGVAR